MFTALGIVVVLFALLLSLRVLDGRYRAGIQQAYYEATDEFDKHLIDIASRMVAERLDTMYFDAASVAVYDVNQSQLIYGRNADAEHGLASLTKVATALTVLDQEFPETSVVLTDAALAQYGEYNFLDGESWPLRDLVAIMLVNSSNDAAFALDESFPGLLDRMNHKMQQLGFSSLEFSSPSGLDLPGRRLSARGSALDIAQLVAYFYQAYPYLAQQTVAEELVLERLNGGVYTAVNTHKGLSQVPALMFSKTGYTSRAGGTLAVVIEPLPEYPVVIVALQSSFEGRFSDVKRMADIVYSTYRVIYK